MHIARDVQKRALSVCLKVTLVYCAPSRLSCFRYGASVMNAHLKAIFLGGSALLVAACETTLPDAGSPATASSANTLISPAEDTAVPATPSANAAAAAAAAAEDTLAENTVAENNDAGSTADSDAVTPAGSDQTTNS